MSKLTRDMLVICKAHNKCTRTDCEHRKFHHPKTLCQIGCGRGGRDGYCSQIKDIERYITKHLDELL